MANINDYLLWRGDLPICRKFEFNEVDSMIFARFSYLLFDKISMASKERIASISEKMKNIDNEQFLYNGDKELITYLGKSERFKDLLVTDYVKINNRKIEKQFAAITIHLSNKEMYISFIGTDATLYGWKEDFNMAFMENVPCQISGKEYLEKIARKYPNKQIRIGGHSKGGNVAIYSAITNSEKIQKRIIKVYNYDGPGFNKNIVDKYENEKIMYKIETYIPQDSIIGRLLTHNEKTTVVLSTEKGILQHDIYSWEVLKDDLIKLEKNTEISEDIDRTVTDWLETTTVEQRKIFIDLVFELLYSTDASTFIELSQNFSIYVPKILKKYGEMSADDKKIMTKMLMLMMSSYMNIIKEKGSAKFDNIRDKYVIKNKK